MKFGSSVIKKIPGEVLKKINQKIGFWVIIKSGTKGISNLTKLVPVVGGIIGGGFDYSSTKIIAGRANIVFDNSGVIHFGYFNWYYF